MADAPGSPKENLQKWAGSTMTKVDDARALTEELLKNLGDPLLMSHGGLSAKPRTKWVDIHRKTNNLASCDDSSDGCVKTLQVIRTLVHQMQQEVFRLYGPNEVCTWRISLREKRPSEELFCDNLQEAMESEHKVLKKNREELLGRIEEGKKLCQDLEEMKNHIDINRRQEYDIPGPGKEPRKPQMPLDDRLGQVKGLLQKSATYGADCQHLVAKSQGESARWGEKTNVAIDKHLTDTMQLKKHLEKQLSQTDKAIIAAEKEIRSASFRPSLQNDPEHSGKLKATEDMLKRLKETRLGLQDELQHKQISYKITKMCKTCTPRQTKTPLHKTSALQYACGTGKVTLPHSASAPLLGFGKRTGAMSMTNSTISVDGSPTSPLETTLERPKSPAGVSSSLKIAGVATMS